MFQHRRITTDSFAAEQLKAQGEKLTPAPESAIQGPDPDLLNKTTPKIDKLLEELLHLNVIELNQLMNAFQARLGLTDAQLGLGMGGGGQQAAASAPVVEEVKKEKETFDLKITAFDEKSKIKVIKEVRTITGLGLKEVSVCHF